MKVETESFSETLCLQKLTDGQLLKELSKKNKILEDSFLGDSVSSAV